MGESSAIQKASTPAPASPAPTAASVLLIQRKCACGSTPGADGECEQCRKKRLGVQTKLRVGAPGDRFEREADRLAAQVVAGRPAGAISSVGAGGVPQRSVGEARGAAESEVLPPAGGGRPLDPATLASMQASLGHDFSRVRIHDGPRAAASARALDARAYTVGERIVFGAGQLDTTSAAGRHLLAHELVHVAQQGAAQKLDTGPAVASAIGERRVQRAPAPSSASSNAGVAPAASTAQVAACTGHRLLQVRDARDNARWRARKVAERLKDYRRPKVKRAFRAIFGDDSMDARTVVQETLEAIGQLKFSEDQADAKKKNLIFFGCADSSHAHCGAGANAFFQPAKDGDPEMLLACPDLVEDAGGKVLRVKEGSVPALAREAIMLHEMVHAARQSGALDVYTGTRLMPLLSELSSPSGDGSAATVNPDSIVRFVYKSLATYQGFGKKRGAVARSKLDDVFADDRRDTYRGYVGRRKQREGVRLAVALADQWLQLGRSDLPALEAELAAVTPGSDTWEEVGEEHRRTAALLAGGELTGTSPTCPAGQPKVAITCPDPPTVVTEQDVETVERVTGLVRDALSPFREREDGDGLATDSPGARLSSLRPEEPEETSPRAVAIRRADEGAAQFDRGAETDAGRAPDVLRVGPDLLAEPTLGARARLIVEAVLTGVGAGAEAAPLADFLERNGARADRDSSATLGIIAGRP